MKQVNRQSEGRFNQETIQFIDLIIWLNQLIDWSKCNQFIRSKFEIVASAPICCGVVFVVPWEKKSVSKKVISLLTISLPFVFLLVEAGCRILEKPGNRPPPAAGLPGPEFQLPAGFFLYPAPAANDRNRNVMQDLLAAPLMNQNLILKTALQFEDSSRQKIRKRREKLRGLFCKNPAATRERLLGLWRDQQQREHRLWLNTRDRYEQAVDFRLRRSLAEPVLKEVRAARRLVIRLQEERTKIVGAFWERLLAELANGKTAAGFCDLGVQGGENPPAEQHLNAPLYLARYQFYNLLPPPLRMRLILELHSGK